MVKNLMAALITIAKGVRIAQVVTGNAIPQVEILLVMIERLDTETLESIQDGVTMGLTGRVDVHNPVVAETDEEIHKHVQKAAI